MSDSSYRMVQSEWLKMSGLYQGLEGTSCHLECLTQTVALIDQKREY